MNINQIDQPSVDGEPQCEKNKLVVLCFGSNTHDASALISRAWDMLESQGCRLVRTTDDYPSSSGYMNRVVEVVTSMSSTDLNALTKQIEHLLGREPWMKEAAIVPIDIDIVVYAGRTLRPQDFSSAYFQSGLSSLH